MSEWMIACMAFSSRRAEELRTLHKILLRWHKQGFKYEIQVVSHVCSGAVPPSTKLMPHRDRAYVSLGIRAAHSEKILGSLEISS